jgi:hypothetical protein
LAGTAWPVAVSAHAGTVVRRQRQSRRHHVNAGTVSHEVKSGKHVLTLSKDFPVPDAPDPHWRLVDSKGNVFLLDRVKIKDDRINTSITVPDYVSDIAKVEIWCAFVEVVLGEASFVKPIALEAAKYATK